MAEAFFEEMAKMDVKKESVISIDNGCLCFFVSAFVLFFGLFTFCLPLFWLFVYVLFATFLKQISHETMASRDSQLS